MTIHASNTSKLKRYYQIVPAVFLSALILTACQKTPEPEAVDETPVETKDQTTPVTTNINVADPNDNNVNEDTTSSADSERDVSLTQLEDNLETTDTSPTNASASPSPEQAIKGAQITDVRYKSAAGESLSVVFETSAAGLLNAIVTLPNKPKMTLTAPEGQGNNPTYRSSDGDIQLVSHAGGGTIDLIRNDKITSFDAVSADAEVVAE
ncbi:MULTISPECIES: hypothetical protein [Psychrobacter]|uniref:C-type lysozyme inhibitor domain-containing protein n=1 Tax=Psychrobacter alimentarius TaxID=261164 RepID=A0ABM6A0D6_9GAMM|nr:MULTISPECIES: hypothetical protein [Psychrobacter]AMT97783.1 hypothetical protein A3K91_2203 [Psychrobacter alimentarius]QCB29934.1 hypothetical protein E5677_02405 [Psychrobacter sp. PAMC27889]